MAMKHQAGAVVLFSFMGLALCPTGCAGSREEYTVLSPSYSEQSSAPIEFAIPENVATQLHDCVRNGAGDLRTYAHTTKFALTVTDDGNVEEVNLRSSTLGHGAMESCMMRALTSLSIPSSVFSVRSSAPISGGESTLPPPNSLGFVQVLGGAVALGPIVIIAAGVTVTVYVAAEVAEALRNRRRIEKLCMPWLVDCLGNSDQPNWNIDYFGPKKDCQSCFEECKHKKGQWPDYKCPRAGYRSN